MSPITIQAARLASRQALWAPLRQQAFRRSLSSTASRRSAASASQAGDWGRIIKSRVGVAMIYFPGMGLVLGWPWIAAALFNGRM